MVHSSTELAAWTSEMSTDDWVRGHTTKSELRETAAASDTRVKPPLNLEARRRSSQKTRCQGHDDAINGGWEGGGVTISHLE